MAEAIDQFECRFLSRVEGKLFIESQKKIYDL